MTKPRLELVWINKDHRPRLEPRVLVEDTTRGWKSRGGGLADNRLIYGDNLLALKALEQEFAGRVKCCFIDPPYNTGSAFAHYDDGMEHSLWLSLMRDRLELIRRLLSDDGSLWITIDDNEAHYLKVMCDEVFGRANFVANVMWEKKFSPQNDARRLSLNHDHILVYSKAAATWRPNLLPRSIKQDSTFKNPDNDTRGPWVSADYTCAKTREERPNLFYPILNPNTQREVWPKPIRVWAFEPTSHEKNVAEGLVWWGLDGRNPVPRLKKFADRVQKGTVPTTVWRHDEVGNNQEAKREVIAFNPGNPFATPKPERLIKRVLEIATNPGDLVLDSFAGSGTTGAVAHKMGRRWIMVELGEHCHTHIIPRLKKVIDGADEGGVTAATGWKGGGGYRYFRIAPSVVTRDRHGREVLSKQVSPAILAEALCKLEGFVYAPSDTVWWQQGRANERSFLCVIDEMLTRERLASISDEVGEGRMLVVFCQAFRGAGGFANLDVRKIPNAIRALCEWDRDDYSLNVRQAPARRGRGKAATPVVAAE